MQRTAILLSTFVIAWSASSASAQPASLLDQAIEENNDSKGAAKLDGAALAKAADRLVERTFESVRKDILAATAALRHGDRRAAKKHAERALTRLDALPKYVDARDYRDRARGLLRKAVRGKVRRPVAAAKSAKSTKRKPVPTDEEILRMTDQGDDAGDAGFLESGEIVDVDALLDDDQRRHAYERELDDALRRSRSDWIFRTNEAAIAPLADMAYPGDWPRKVAQRARYRDGVLYEGQPFVGEDGQTYITTLYDLGDLVHPIPNFYASYPGTAREQRTQELDRMYLRMRSRIFNGYPGELAAGLPLLHFFGGIDNNAISTRTDPYQTARIVRTIESFINVGGGADDLPN